MPLKLLLPFYSQSNIAVKDKVRVCVFICEMLKHCWPTCNMVYNHKGCAMKFWLLDVILKPFAPVMEMQYTTNTRYGRESWRTTPKFKVSVGEMGCLCLGDQEAVKRCWECAWRFVPTGPEWFCSGHKLVLCCGSEHCQWHRVGTIIPPFCSHSWLGGTRVTVGEMFKSTWMAWSALCHFWAWLTCSGAAAHRKIMCFVCQRSQQSLKILPSKVLVDEGLLDLSGCDGFYLLSCCSFCCQLIQI